MLLLFIIIIHQKELRINIIKIVDERNLKSYHGKPHDIVFECY